MFMPYDIGSVMPESGDIGIDLLQHGILLDSPEAAGVATGSSALDPKLIGANILNDKNRFEVKLFKLKIDASNITNVVSDDIKNSLHVSFFT